MTKFYGGLKTKQIGRKKRGKGGNYTEIKERDKMS